MINNFNYYTESELVFEVMNTFVEKLSCELSTTQQIEFNKIQFILNYKNEEFDQNDSEFVNDLEQLKTVMERYLDEFSLNSLNLFSIHESEQKAHTNMICYSTNKLDEKEQLLFSILNCDEFTNNENEEKMPSNLNIDDYIDEISNELDKKHLDGTYDHYSNDDLEHLDIYFKIQLQNIIIYCDFSKINTFDSNEIDHDKFEDLLRDMFNSQFKFIDLTVKFDYSNALDVIIFLNESNYDDSEIESIIESDKIWESDIYKD